MSPTVLLLLSMLTVRGSGCDDFMKATVQNLQGTINREKRIGFSQVFPKNYFVSHYFNDSALCNEPCCVFSAAVILSNSWTQLLWHLNNVHIKYRFISELKLKLDEIAKEKFLEPPDLSTLQSVQSSPEVLLSFTSALFSRWLNLDCAFGEHDCIFPTNSEEDQENLVSQEEGNFDSSELVDVQEPVKEGEIGKRQFDHGPTNGYESSFPSFSRWILPVLWIATCVTSI
ncbi:uncharacterized protein LOC127658209 isoform X1 [Xyrauchen texanus]|uniref:uncharacterized protein LOC127658209 isoform X1 n=2 Tax=Xyrauchen texanus TaxID=154827 RepID=UPI002241A8D7|nr:uncharacterized protein LOC127658209 isoform X1 [Xyrauchen texanus]XP_052003334.1 uncharacterized protein LOC127658209 isoform X1 [Xyrauchen texanus]